MRNGATTSSALTGVLPATRAAWTDARPAEGTSFLPTGTSIQPLPKEVGP